MKIGKTFLAFALTVSFISMMFIVPQNASADWDSLTLVDGEYTGTNIYVPGETIDMVLKGGDDERYDVYVIWGTDEIQIRDSVRLVGGEAEVSYTVNDDLPDGNYKIRIRDDIDESFVDEANFTVQGYVFLIETDRDAYLDGDTMKIFWTANNLKDQTLPPAPEEGYAFIRMHNETMVLHEEELDTSAGSISVPLPPLIEDYDEEYWVDGWFNDSATATPIRMQYSRAIFSMKQLGVIIDLDKEQYSPGSILSIQVKTVVTDNQSYPSIYDTAEPGCDISIRIYNINNRVYPIPGDYQNYSLQTNSHGMIKVIVPLDDEYYDDDNEYAVEVEASKGNRDRTEEAGFRISEFSSLSVVLDFDKTQYTSGETLNINASASSIGGGSEFTFLIEIRDSVWNGTLFSRETQATGDFDFTIPLNFVEGWLWIKVTADDGQGNSASVVQNIEVVYAIVLVNVDKENYVSNDVLTISYDVVGDNMRNPDTFYIVFDSEGYVVDEGVATEGSFTFTIPTAPSSSYLFEVFALENGTCVRGSDTAELFSSYVLTIDFNKNSYGPGNTMVIDYEIFALGDATLPATFVITYGLANGPLASLQTTESRGELRYYIPEDIDEGEQLFMVSCDFGGDVNEIVVIKRGANPLWYLRIGDIPIFDIFLFLLVIAALYYGYRTRKKIATLQRQETQRADKIKRGAPPDISATEECVECGNPIEITTSRRPIEVMCPHCGEIQHVEK